MCQLVNPAGGDYRPVVSSVTNAAVFAIPAFPGGDGPARPPEPEGNLTNAVIRDRADSPRHRSWPPGAYTGGTSMLLQVRGAAGGALALDLIAEPGYAYRVDETANLHTNWLPLFSVALADRTNRFALSVEGVPSQFYRAVLLP